MNWLDILLLVVFFLHLANGLTRGLVKQFFDLIGFIVIVVVSYWGSRHFSGLLEPYIDPEAIIPSHPLIESIGLEAAFGKAPQLISGIIIFLILFLVLSLLFRILSGSFRWINRIPVIGFFNRIGGAVLGAMIGMAFVYIIITGMSLIPLHFFSEALDQSQVVFITDFYLAPVAAWLQKNLLIYLLNLNG